MKDQELALTTNQKTTNDIRRIIKIFQQSQGQIRPHTIITGPSGSGKSHLLESLSEDLRITMMSINAAQLTKEGTSGNSLSKALAPLLQSSGKPTICFVDEFDKMFISGNSNSHLAHETTNGVQNEFLKVLEGKNTSVYGDYGKYIEARCDNVLFFFAGAFNGEENITLDRLRDFGIKTEFLGRVGLTFALQKLTIDDLAHILNRSNLLANYLKLFPDANKETVVDAIMDAVRENFDNNTLGVRILSTLTHRYFINGGELSGSQVKESTFQTTMTLDKSTKH